MDDSGAFTIHFRVFRMIREPGVCRMLSGIRDPVMMILFQARPRVAVSGCRTCHANRERPSGALMIFKRLAEAIR
jgi:hypothetical protein